MNYALTRAAEADLVDIYLTGAQLFGIGQADHYTGDLHRILGYLSAHPRVGRLRSQISAPVFTYAFKSHIVVYEAMEDGDVVILRIRHARED